MPIVNKFLEDGVGKPKTLGELRALLVFLPDETLVEHLSYGDGPGFGEGPLTVMLEKAENPHNRNVVQFSG